MKIVENSIDFDANKGHNYRLTVTVGDGQVGTHSMKDFFGNYITGEVKNHFLGKGTDLEGKTLIVSSTVTDTNPKSDWTSITFYLNDTKIGEFSSEVEKEKGSIFYITAINFS